ncbi:histidinol-phosphatase HisJ [Jeotgalibacillus aurantiacus]|uniref:histidinol-phosphatase HisJ n=1 Tax=Jeotgalibacillus aurantiacus TaxID=2763266 RepID=UPI001D0ACC64|nr:histidinol-phosphatase HisJ [Jeotgalibacillus aurantiacus]
MPFRDGHIHSPYCPHGSRDSFYQYIERAITLGYKEISFMEHAPLPKGFTDPVPDQDSGMNPDDLEKYLSELSDLKKQYKRDLIIHTGLEVDFIEGFEAQTTDFLNRYGHELDDSILSVHFLKNEDGYVCMDFDPDAFKTLIDTHGTIDHVHSLYYKTVLSSIEANLGQYKPQRIGHITLANKFRKLYPPESSHEHEINLILQAIKKNNLELDYNGAGTVKPYCLEVYPPAPVALKAKELGIPLIYGSDAHTASGLHQGADQLIALKP